MRRVLHLGLCTMFFLFCCGCFNKNEPKTLALVLSTLYDIDEAGMYKSTVEFMNPEGESGGGTGGGVGGGGGGGSATVKLETSGPSLAEALRASMESMERRITGGQNNVRFVTERFASGDMPALLDYFARDHLTDETPFFVVVRAEDPSKIYTASTGLASSLGEFFGGLYDN